ncbi:MAG: STAS domain-containing protein [Anaerolineae bacterium]|nr:STAS domain-containing protein [Anaerolineae bacterium]
MKITTEQKQGHVPVTVMKLTGELDASCYLEVIAAARQLYQQGNRHLLLDLSEMSFMSSAGLMALHSITMLMQGKEPPNPEDGWGAMHDIAHDVDQSTGLAVQCKLLRPQPRVAKTLTITGFDQILQIFTDLDEALNAFA